MSSPSDLPHHVDTVIVGAGLAGLTAAVHLARAGTDVLVIERNADPGGRARTRDVDGWLFNEGPHALYRDGIGRKTLLDLGIDPAGSPAPLAGAQFGLDGTTTALPTGAISLVRTAALSGAETIQFAKLMATITRITPADHASETVDEWLSPFRPRVRAVVAALVRLSTYSTATDMMSADAAITQLALGNAGVLYLDGGWRSLIDRLSSAAVDAGAVIRSGSRVASIERSTDNASSQVRVGDATFLAANVIVAAGGPTFTAELLGLETDRFAGVGPSSHAAVLDLALDSMPDRHRFVLGLDQPTYFSVHSPPADMAPPGQVAAVAMRYLDPGDAATADEHRSSLDHIATVAGAKTVVHERFLRRMTVTQGIPVASSGGMAGRPPVRVPAMPGVHVAGDWVGPHGMLADTSIASGRDAARAVLAR